MDCRGYDLRSLNSSKADADDATLIERVELAASYPIAFPKGMSGITPEKVGAGDRSLNAAAAAWAATRLAWDENRHGFAIGVGEKSSASMRPNTAYKCSSVRSVV